MRRGQVVRMAIAAVVFMAGASDCGGSSGGSSGEGAADPPAYTSAAAPAAQCVPLQVPAQLVGVVTGCQYASGRFDVTNATTVTLIARSVEGFSLTRIPAPQNDLTAAVLEADAGATIGPALYLPPEATIIVPGGTVNVEQNLRLSARTTAMQAVGGYATSRFMPRRMQLQKQFSDCGDGAAASFDQAYRASGGVVDAQTYLAQSVETVSACKSLYSLLKELDGEPEPRTFQTEVRAALAELRSATRTNWQALFDDVVRALSRTRP